MNRRKFLSLLGIGLLATGSGSSLIYASAVEPYTIEIVEKRIPLPGLAAGFNGLRTVQISDLHMGSFISLAQLERVLALVLAQKPELVFITGDFITIDGNMQRAFDDLYTALRPLAQQVPVYATLGNHDVWRHAVPKLYQMFEDLGIHGLANTILPFHKNGDTLYIAGVESVDINGAGLYFIDQAAPADAPIILLAHEPDIADTSASLKKIVFQISGHSHGGQVNLPLLGRLILPWMGRKYPAGLYRIEDMLLYTNRGIGMYHLPIRINCPPEITVFTFIPA